MKKNYRRSLLNAAAIGLLTLPGLVCAGEFQVSEYGDTILGFRKPGVGTYELVVNLGNITNFVGLAAGTTIPISNYTPAQLTDAFPDGFSNLNWSVSSSALGSFTPWAGYYPPTLWYTLPRANVNSQTVPPTRASTSTQSVNRQNMLGADSGAGSISTSLGASNQDNTPVLVREPVWDGVSQVRYDLSYFIDNTGSGPIGSFGLPNVVENTTPANFNSAVRSDLYQSVPTGYTDPQSGTNNGSAYYVGYFQLNPDGTMTFTRASVSTEVPPPQITKITRSGSTTRIYFTTTNGPTYTLHYTNSAGLSQPVANWPSSPTTLTGNGSTTNLTDITSDANRFYRVSAH